LREYQQLLIDGHVSIFVRRAGPNYQEGLRVMRELGKTQKFDFTKTDCCEFYSFCLLLFLNVDLGRPHDFSFDWSTYLHFQQPELDDFTILQQPAFKSLCTSSMKLKTVADLQHHTCISRIYILISL